VWFTNNLLASIWYMDKTSADVWISLCCHVQNIVHNAVAYIGACGVGHKAWQTMAAYIFYDGIDRNGSKVCRLTVSLQRLVHWRLAVVIRNSCFCQIDSNALDGNAGATASLSNVDNNVRIVLFDCCFYSWATSCKNGRNFNFDNLRTSNGIRQQFDCLISRIYFFSAKWVKTCNQDFHKKNPP